MLDESDVPLDFVDVPKPKNKGGWVNSKKERVQHKKLLAHLHRQEKKWRKVVLEKVRTYTPDEVLEFARARGLGVAPSVLAKTRGR